MSEDHSLTNHQTEQTRKNISQPVQRPGTTVDDERHVLEVLTSRKDILTLLGGPWVCAVSALVQEGGTRTNR